LMCANTEPAQECRARTCGDAKALSKRIKSIKTSIKE
jgi:hypothetical protein